MQIYFIWIHAPRYQDFPYVKKKDKLLNVTVSVTTTAYKKKKKKKCSNNNNTNPRHKVMNEWSIFFSFFYFLHWKNKQKQWKLLSIIVITAHFLIKTAYDNLKL